MLSIRDLMKSYAAGGGEPVTAVDGVSLVVEPGQLFTLLGPSGSGKTTTLRCVAGLERPDAGEIEVAGRVLFSASGGVAVPANRRGLGMVFQSYGVWPHMTVFDTVAFPLVVAPRAARAAKREVRERVERTLALVQLEGLGGRRATDLSGGQQQRLALARALVMEPPLLLMDEPLSNLDARLRDDMRLELKRLQRELGVTVLYVTHDQADALAMSNLVAVMKDGRIEQVAKPREIYEHPATRFVAEFIGSPNLLDGVITESADGLHLVSTAYGSLRARQPGAFRAGDAVVVSVHSERITLEAVARADGRPNCWPGTVRTRAFRGDSIEHVVAVGDVELRARCHPSISAPPGTAVAVVLPEDGCSVVGDPHV